MTPTIRKVCLCLCLFMCGFLTIPARADSWLELVPIGSWGGGHIRLEVTKTGAKVEYDCAFGTINGPLILEKDGTFEAHGTYVYERGGPIRLGEPPHERHPALYRGWTDGNEMRLTVMLQEKGEVVGSFTLGLGRPPVIEKCL